MKKLAKNKNKNRIKWHKITRTYTSNSYKIYYITRILKLSKKRLIILIVTIKILIYFMTSLI